MIHIYNNHISFRIIVHFSLLTFLRVFFDISSSTSSSSSFFSSLFLFLFFLFLHACWFEWLFFFFRLCSDGRWNRYIFAFRIKILYTSERHAAVDTGHNVYGCCCWPRAAHVYLWCDCHANRNMYKYSAKRMDGFLSYIFHYRILHTYTNTERTYLISVLTLTLQRALVCTDTAEQRHTYIHTVLSNTIALHILCSCVCVCVFVRLNRFFARTVFHVGHILNRFRNSCTFTTFRDYPNSILHVWVCARDLPPLTIVSSKRFQHHQLIDSLSTWLTDTLMYVIKWHCFLAFISIEMSFNADI